MDRKFKVIIFGLFLSLFSLPAFAWENSINIGYGISKDINYPENVNSGFLLNGALFTLAQGCWWHFTINGSLGNWYSNAPTDRNLLTGALTLGLRVYAPQVGSLHPYLLASGGPAGLSHRQFGQNQQGSNFAFEVLLGFGVEKLNLCNQGLDINVKIVHYSNAYLFEPNDGFNILPVLSIGYLF